MTGPIYFETLAEFLERCRNMPTEVTHRTDDWETTGCGRDVDELPDEHETISTGKHPLEYGRGHPCPKCYPEQASA